MQKVFGLPLMPRLAVTFANHGKSNQKRFGERRQNHSAQANAQPQLSRSKQPQTHRRSNSEAVLPRCARPLGIRRRLCVRLAVKVPTQVLHRLTEKHLFFS
jgi:hypothetical protein